MKTELEKIQEENENLQKEILSLRGMVREIAKASKQSCQKCEIFFSSHCNPNDSCASNMANFYAKKIGEL